MRIVRLNIAIASTLVLIMPCGLHDDLREAPSEEPTFSQFSFLEGNQRDPAWSPDGKWIVFGGGLNGMHLWKMPVAGGEVIQLTSGPYADVYPAFSPDGSRIAFSSDRGGGFNLWTIPAAGGEPTPVTANEDSVTSWGSAWGGSTASWSPDGTLLVFSSSKGGSDNIWIIPVSGNRPARQLTRNPADDENPEWSPDGTQVAFTSFRSGNADIWIVPAVGGTPRQITDHAADNWWNRWSPDGEWLVFTSTRDDQFDIWIVPSADGAAVPITDTPEYDTSPTWECRVVSSLRGTPDRPDPWCAQLISCL